MTLRACYKLSPAQIRLLLRVYETNVGDVYHNRAPYWRRPVRCKAPVGHALSRQGLGRTEASEAGWAFAANDPGMAVAARVRGLFIVDGKGVLCRLCGDGRLDEVTGPKTFTAEVPHL